MSVEVIGLITLVIGAISLFYGPAFGVCVFVPATLLGSAGAVLLGGSGTIQPAHLMLGFLVASAFPHRIDWSAPRRNLGFPKPGFWLAAFTTVAVLSAVILPRLFARSTSINAIGSTDYGPSLLLVPLGPTSGNLTQSIYVTADLICFLVCSALADRIEGFWLLTKVVCAYCFLNIAFAFVDLATFWTNTSFLLDVIRNADYQLHVETVVTGLKRIVGSFTETSSFAYATLGALGFSAELWLSGFRPRLFFSVALVSLVLLVFSTSTTAYATTPLLLIILYVKAVVGVATRPSPRSAHAFVLLGPIAAIVLVSAIALTPKAVSAISDVVTTMVLEKSSSQSGLERAQWNATALRNFVDTLGVGAGLGSVRASSFLLALLSNCGILGFVLFAGFFACILLGRRAPQDHAVSAVRNAARVACLALLIGASVSGALVDLGLQFFVFAAVACAEPRRVTATSATIPFSSLTSFRPARLRPRSGGSLAGVAPTVQALRSGRC